MNQIMTGKSLTIFGDGEQTRDFTYIDDVAPAIAKSIQCPEAYGETFNIGGDRAHTVNELATLVSEEMGIPAEITHLPARKETKHAVASHCKAKAYLELSDPVPLRVGISRMADWAQSVGGRRTKGFSNIEIPFGLPSGW